MKAALKRIWEVANLAVVINAVFLVVFWLLLFILTSPFGNKLSRAIKEMKSPAQDTSNYLCETNHEKVDEAIAIATKEGKFWDTIQTVEEYYKELYSADDPPPYWRMIEEDFALGKDLGLNTSMQLPSYAALTRKERLLLCNMGDNSYPIDTVHRLSIFLTSHKLRSTGKLTKAPAAFEWAYGEAIAQIPEDYSLSDEARTLEKVRHWQTSTLVRLHLSPISDKPMLIDRNEFSAGNAYTEFHYGDEEWIKLMPAFIAFSDCFSPQTAQENGLLYYRIYGEKTVIAEGVRALPYIGRYIDLWGGERSYAVLPEVHDGY